MDLKINDTIYPIVEEPARMLLWVLRDELGLTGTKFGCGAGYCGSCTVHVNGVATRSCQTLIGGLAEAEITTIEGLGGPEAGHPVQRAFLEQQVHQCGWCQSGQMMTAAALLAENPSPEPAQIVEAMKNNYCRCATYTRIRRAVARAAELAQEGN